MAKSIHSYIASFWGLVFLLFAYFQLNDPDPLVWISIYSLFALICFLFIFQKVPRWLIAILGLLAFFGAIWLFPIQFQGLDLKNFAMKTQDLSIELARESLGLGICGLVMVYLWLVHPSKISS